MSQFMHNLIEWIFDHTPAFFQNVFVEISSYFDISKYTTFAWFFVLFVLFPITYFLTKKDV
jgi:hypothetical protein